MVKRACIVNGAHTIVRSVAGLIAIATALWLHSLRIEYGVDLQRVVSIVVRRRFECVREQHIEGRLNGRGKPGYGSADIRKCRFIMPERITTRCFVPLSCCTKDE